VADLTKLAAPPGPGVKHRPDEASDNRRLRLQLIERVIDSGRKKTTGFGNYFRTREFPPRERARPLNLPTASEANT
jgi:hypothetical protein